MLDFFLGRGQAISIFLIAGFLAVTLLAMTRALPAQNVLAVAFVMAILTFVIQTAAEKLSVPFGPFFYTQNLGPSVFNLVPWPVVAIWLIATLNSRGAARLILRPWRDLPNYGFASLALTAALTVVFDANLEPFAARTRHFWIWQTRNPSFAWYGAPWVNFASRFAVTILLLACATPWLIVKKPEADPPPQYPPLALWSLAVLLLTVINAANQLWLAAAFGLVTTCLVTIVAFRNSRR